MKADVICITQSGAPASGASSNCFMRMKIWSSELLIFYEEKRCSIV